MQFCLRCFDPVFEIPQPLLEAFLCKLVLKEKLMDAVFNIARCSTRRKFPQLRLKFFCSAMIFFLRCSNPLFECGQQLLGRLRLICGRK